MKPAFDGNYGQFVRSMEAARRQLDSSPDDQEWTQEQVAALDDVRYAALRLSEAAEAIINLESGESP